MWRNTCCKFSQLYKQWKRNLSDQWIGNLNTGNYSRPLWRNCNRDLDIHRCLCKNHNTNKSYHGKPCTCCSVCSSATNHRCMRCSCSKFIKLYERRKWCLSDQRIGNLNTGNYSRPLWRNCNRDLDIHRCLCKNHNTNKSYHSKPCTCCSVCSRITNHRCMRCSSNKFSQLYKQWKRNLSDQWIGNINTGNCSRPLWRNCNRDLDIYRCLSKNHNTNKSYHSKPCTCCSVCSSATYHRCMRCSSNKFSQLYKQWKRNLSDQWIGNIDIKCTAWCMRRSGNRDLDIYRCLCKNHNTNKSYHSKPCTCCSVCSRITYHRCMRCSSNKFSQLYKQWKRNLSDQWIGNIDIKCTAWCMRRSGNRDLDIYRCLCKNHNTNKNDHGKPCTCCSVCSSATNHRCMRCSSNKFSQLYKQWKRNLSDQWIGNIDIKCTAWCMRRSGNRDVDIHRCLCKNHNTNKSYHSKPCTCCSVCSSATYHRCMRCSCYQ